MTTQNEPIVEPIIEEPKADKGDTVSREAYEKVLREKKNLSEKTKALELEKETLTKAQLKEKEDYKAMYELTEKKAKELEEKISAQTQKEVQSRKYTEMKKEWAKMGLKDDKQAEALFRLANVEALKYDEEHQIVLGVEEEAKRVKELMSPLFGNLSAGTNHDAPKGAPVNLSLESWKQMSPADRKKHEADLYKSLGVTLRK